MYLIDALKLLLRRWLVVLLGLIATGGACAYVLDNVGPDYQASSQMLFLLPPKASGPETPTNPYLNLQSGLATAASLVAGEVSTKDTRRDLAAAGMKAEYAVSLTPGAGPLLLITAKSKDPALAVATRDAVMNLVDTKLAEMQAAVDVPPLQVISTSRSSVSRSAERLSGSRLRALAGTGGAGMAAVLLAAFAVDRIRRRPTAGGAAGRGSRGSTKAVARAERAAVRTAAKAADKAAAQEAKQGGRPHAVAS